MRAAEKAMTSLILKNQVEIMRALATLAHKQNAEATVSLLNKASHDTMTVVIELNR